MYVLLFIVLPLWITGVIFALCLLGSAFFAECREFHKDLSHADIVMMSASVVCAAALWPITFVLAAIAARCMRARGGF